MDKLQDNDKIAQLLDLLEKNERQGQAADLRQLCGYVDSLEKQYAAVLAVAPPRPTQQVKKKTEVAL